MGFRAVVSVALLWVACLAWGAEVSDSVPDNRSWVRQLWDNGFRLNDPSVRYPKFARFCLNVYNWGDRTFNSYDPEYVVGTGKNWKLLAQDEMWGESYSFFFPRRMRVHMVSEVHNDLGASIHFMAVSLGYTFNTNDMFNHKGAYRSKFDFGFTCALFTGQYTTTKTLGGARIVRFGNYNESIYKGLKFENMSQRTTEGSLFYFFNHRHFSWAAAYCYSKYQIRSAGSWVAGVQYIDQNISIDFSSLPEEMLEQLPEDVPHSFRYVNTDWCVAGGYSYNWAIRPRKWLVNATLIPSIGYKRYHTPGPDGKNRFVSTNMMASMSAVYNHKALFAALTVQAQGYFYFTHHYTFLNSRESANLTVGMRF
ncbi:MAG: DUF4421 domain-containing protein [Muribaculum sp.]|nr:DUF4421 domain-containing protein [Muribaculum sp.]